MGEDTGETPRLHFQSRTSGWSKGNCLIVSLVLEWAFEHREELMENWKRAERREGLKKIEPLV
jgi:hypothetical protein